MKTIKLSFILIVSLFKIGYSQEVSVSPFRNCPPVNELLRPVWEVEVPRYIPGTSYNAGTNLVFEDYVFSSLSSDTAIVLKSGEKIAFPLDLTKDLVLVFQNHDEIIVKNVTTNELLFNDRRRAWIPRQSELLVSDSYKIVYQKDRKKIVAFDLVLKKLIWEYTNLIPLKNNFLVSDNKVYFFDSDGLKVLNSKNGDLLWTMEIGNVYATPYLIGNTLFALTSRNGLFSIDVINRKVLWHYIDDNYTFGSADMIIDDNNIFVSSNKLYSFNLNGELLWKFGDRENFHYDISVVNDYLIAYLEESNPIITVFDKKTGLPLYYYLNDFYDVIGNSVRFKVVNDNLVVAATNMRNIIVCFEILK